MGSIGASKGSKTTRPFESYSTSELQTTYSQYMQAGNTEGANEITKELANRNVKAVPKSSVEINSDRFRAYNGKNPSGFGTWAFNMGGDVVFFSGKYSDAKKQAIEEAARRGVRRVTLET